MDYNRFFDIVLRVFTPNSAIVCLPISSASRLLSSMPCGTRRPENAMS